MADLLPGRGFPGGGAVPGREVPLAGEPGHRGDIDQQPGGAGGADAVQVHQRGPAAADRDPQLGLERLQLGVDRFQVDDQVHRQAPAGGPGRIPRPHPREHPPSLQGGQVPFADAAGDELGQQPVQTGSPSPPWSGTARRGGRPAAASPPGPRSPPTVRAGRGSARRPRRWSGRRWRRSCGPARCRTPAPVPGAWPARPGPVRRPGPAATPAGGRRHQPPRPPRPGAATASRNRSAPGSRRGLSGTGP